MKALRPEMLLRLTAGPVWADDAKKISALIEQEETADGVNQVLRLKDDYTGKSSASDSSDLTLISGGFTPQTGKMAVEFKIKDQLSAAARFFRIILHNGDAVKNPNTKENFLIESYVTDGKLVYRDLNNTGSNATIGTISQNKWYTVKYMIVIENQTFDVYMTALW